ncbi:MAG: hypothetical protein AAF085_11495 [Planctomycetota bacterium]
MSQSPKPDVIHSLDMFQQIIHEATHNGDSSCGGDCANCPCSGEEPKTTKKANENETSDACDKC